MEEAKKKQTIREMGARLPLGVMSADGQLHRSFEVRPWRMKEEKALGELQRSRDVTTPAQYVMSVISYMATRIGQYDMDALSPDERDNVVQQMMLGDVWYIYVWLRIHAIGEHLKVEYDCPHCKRKGLTITADLFTTEVNAVDSLAEATWVYRLANPITIRKRVAEALEMGPLRWSMLLNVGTTGGLGGAKAAAILGACRGIPGAEHQMVLTAEDLEEMTKRDIESIVGKIDDHGLGPIMAIEDKCVNDACKKQIRLPINWEFQSFFGISSE